MADEFYRHGCVLGVFREGSELLIKYAQTIYEVGGLIRSHHGQEHCRRGRSRLKAGVNQALQTARNGTVSRDSKPQPDSVSGVERPGCRLEERY